MLKTAIKTALLVLVSLAIGVYAGYNFAVLETALGCDTDLQYSRLSPTGEYIVSVFDVDCGATTAGSTQLAIRPANELFSAKGHTPAVVLDGRSTIGVDWKNGRELIVKLPEDVKALERLQSVGDIKLLYQ